MKNNKSISNIDNIIELLKPRFLLISDYPGNTTPIGTIITEITTANYLRKFPSNFRELKWWEFRGDDEMPPFVKLVMDGETQFIHKIEKWIGKNSNDEPLYEYNCKVGHLSFLSAFCVKDLDPATSEEYYMYNEIEVEE